MSFSEKFASNTPFKQGGYVGGADVKGAYYVPTGKMYSDMFNKIAKATANIIDKPEVKYGNNKNKTAYDKFCEENPTDIRCR